MPYLILAQSEVTARALGAWLELLGEKALEDPRKDERCEVMDSHRLSHGGGIDAYERTVAWLVSGIGQYCASGSGGVTVLVDSVRPSGLSAATDGMSWDTMIALLILTFPEVRWVFGVGNEDDKDFQKIGLSLPTLFASAKRSPLFDPTGLRGWVRERTNETLENVPRDNLSGRPMQLPMRKNLAAALDDERDFAMIHAYTAYRYGFKADVITSWTLMKELFHVGEGDAKTAHGYDLLMEDMRLAFPDKPGKTPLSSLRDRGEACDLLTQNLDVSKWRFLITSGQTGADDSLTEDNEEFLEMKRVGRGKLIYKPIGGICDLWKKTGLLKEFSEDEDDNPRGNAPNFYWPPKESDDDEYHGHAAPGKLGMVAATLVVRAKAIKSEAQGAIDYLLAATLASDAAELLGGKTPDLTLTALQLKHECEVRAECSFIGTGFHFELNQRFKEIALEVQSVSRWSRHSRRKAIDAQAAIVKDMREAYAEAGQMEEEDRCLVQFRKLNRMMSRPDRWWKHVIVVPWISQCILAYGEWLLSSFSWLLTMIAVWAFISVGWMGWTQDGSDEALESPAKALSSFFGAGPTDVSGLFEFTVSFGIVAVGVFHVGILISYLYSLISRK